MVLGAKHSSHSVCDNPLVNLRVGDLKVLEQLEEFPVLSESRRESWVAVNEGDEMVQVGLLATPEEGVSNVFGVPR